MVVKLFIAIQLENVAVELNLLRAGAPFFEPMRIYRGVIALGLGQRRDEDDGKDAHANHLRIRSLRLSRIWPG